MSTREPSPAKKSTTEPANASTTTVSAPAGRRKGVSRRLDVTLTIVFLILNACLLVAALFVPAPFLALASAGCSDSCNIDVVQAGFNIAVFGPSVVFIVNLVLSIVFLVKKRTTWLLSLLVGVAGLLVFFLGVALIFGQAG